MEILKLYVEAFLQQIALHSSNRSLGVPRQEADGVCIALQVRQGALQHHCSVVDVLEMLLGVFLAVWHASQNPG